MILMGLLNGSPPVCPTDLPCSQWAQTYIKYCLCTTRDSISLALGFLSVLSWGVAEVPQIITNYRHKSAEGLSIAFLMTWILGDLFNLFGCMLEPATLPTQYYMAVLYTITTLILSSQSIYYGHIYHRIKDKSQDLLKTGLKLPQLITEYKEDHISNEEHVKFGDSWTRGSSILQGALPSSPIPVTAPVLPRYGSLGRELYYMSARSLSKSHTPTAGSCLAQTIDHGGTLPFSIGGSHSVEEPLLGTLVFTQSEPPSKTKSMLCVISAVAFLFGSFNFHLSTSSRLKRVRENLPQGVVIRIGRKLLQSSTMLVLRHEGEVSSGIGTFLGWAMAIIYMGGRLPQIYLNIRRGNVEGLSPLMFIFALVGNMTYVASILVSSLQWSKISANLPWLVDAGGCVLLDTCIIFSLVQIFNFCRLLVSPHRNTYTVKANVLIKVFLCGEAKREQGFQASCLGADTPISFRAFLLPPPMMAWILLQRQFCS